MRPSARQREEEEAAYRAARERARLEAEAEEAARREADEQRRARRADREQRPELRVEQVDESKKETTEENVREACRRRVEQKYAGQYCGVLPYPLGRDSQYILYSDLVEVLQEFEPDFTDEEAEEMGRDNADLMLDDPGGAIVSYHLFLRRIF